MSLFFVVLSLRVCWQMFRAVFRCLCVFSSAQLEGLLADFQSRVQMSMCFCSAQLEGLLADVQSRVQQQEGEFRGTVGQFERELAGLQEEMATMKADKERVMKDKESLLEEVLLENF